MLRLFGTPVRLDWTWLVAFAVFAGFFSVQTAAQIALAMLAALLAYEAVHAYAARTQRVRIKYAVLFPFGAVYHSEVKASTPASQAIVSAAAPVASLALSIGFAVCALSFEPDTTPFQTLILLAVIGGLIAAVNAMPLYPLDGGHLLRALLWRVSNNPDRASGIVAALSALAGWAFACTAVALIADRNAGYGIAAAVLAWLIMRPAENGRRRDNVQEPTVRARCADLMDRPGAALQPDITCAEALRKLISSGQRSAPIAVGRKFIGILALSDFAKLGARDPQYVYVSVIMTPAERLVKLEPATPGTEAQRRLFESGYHQLPVVGKTGALLGFINRKAAD